MAQWHHYDGQKQRTPSWLETIQDLRRPCTLCIPSQYHSDIRGWTCHDNASVLPSEEAVPTCKPRCPWQFAVLAQQRRECHSTSYLKQGGFKCFVILEIFLVWFGFYVSRYVDTWHAFSEVYCHPCGQANRQVCDASHSLNSAQLFGTGVHIFEQILQALRCWSMLK